MIDTNAKLEPLPWETEPSNQVETPVVNSVVKSTEPPRKSLAWMKLHLRELVLLRTGRTYKPAPDPEFDRRVEEAKAIFTAQNGL